MSYFFPWHWDSPVLIGFYSSRRAESPKGGVLKINVPPFVRSWFDWMTRAIPGDVWSFPSLKFGLDAPEWTLSRSANNQSFLFFQLRFLYPALQAIALIFQTSPSCFPIEPLSCVPLLPSSFFWTIFPSCRLVQSSFPEIISLEIDAICGLKLLVPRCFKALNTDLVYNALNQVHVPWSWFLSLLVCVILGADRYDRGL